MCILVEASQQTVEPKAQRIWDLLSNLYSSNAFLVEISEDRRRVHAAELVVAAWKAREHKTARNLCPPKPAFVTILENQLKIQHTKSGQKRDADAAQLDDAKPGSVQLPSDELFPEQKEADFDFNLDFQDIDWSFWSSID